MNKDEELRMQQVYREIAKLKNELRKKERLISELQKECQDLETYINGLE